MQFKVLFAVLLISALSSPYATVEGAGEANGALDPSSPSTPGASGTPGTPGTPETLPERLFGRISPLLRDLAALPGQLLISALENVRELSTAFNKDLNDLIAKASEHLNTIDETDPRYQAWKDTLEELRKLVNLVQRDLDLLLERSTTGLKELQETLARLKKNLEELSAKFNEAIENGLLPRNTLLPKTFEVINQQIASLHQNIQQGGQRLRRRLSQSLGRGPASTQTV